MEVKYSLQCIKLLTLFLQLCTVRALARAIFSMAAVHCKMLRIFSFPAFCSSPFFCQLLLAEWPTFLHYFEIEISLIKLVKLLITPQQNTSFY